MSSRRSSQLEENILKETKRGKMSFLTLLQNLPNASSITLTELVYDRTHRYCQLKNDELLYDYNRLISNRQIERDQKSICAIVQQRTSSSRSIVFLTNTVEQNLHRF